MTLEAGDTRAALTVKESHAYGQLVMQTALEASQAIRECDERPGDTRAL